MTKIGLTSVIFRTLSCLEIIDLAAKNKLSGIEWGADIHIIPGDLQQAEFVKNKSAVYNLEVLSYGSYYKLCQGMSIEVEFHKILETAKVLGAPVIRIWATRTASKDAAEELYSQAAEELRTICGLAIEHDIDIALEYHRKSLTDSAESIIKLLKLTNCSNLFSYWQPNPELTMEENKKEIMAIKDYLKYIHVFHWQANNARLLLETGREDWINYIQAIGNSTYIIEFVLDDKEINFEKDIYFLKKILKDNQLLKG